MTLGGFNTINKCFPTQILPNQIWRRARILTNIELAGWDFCKNKKNTTYFKFGLTIFSIPRCLGLITRNVVSRFLFRVLLMYRCSAQFQRASSTVHISNHSPQAKTLPRAGRGAPPTIYDVYDSGCPQLSKLNDARQYVHQSNAKTQTSALNNAVRSMKETTTFFRRKQPTKCN